MTNEEAVCVLQMLAMAYGTCRTEKEALNIAINVLEEGEEDGRGNLDSSGGNCRGRGDNPL